MYSCPRCDEFVTFDHYGDPHCRCTQGSRVVAALVFAIGVALLIALRIVGTPDEWCEANPSFLLQGTMQDCAARNPPADLPLESALARAEW